jgi:hypothetical protein
MATLPPTFRTAPIRRELVVGCARAIRLKVPPLPSLGEQPGRRMQRPHSNTLWVAPFDNTESRLGERQRHVVGHYRLGEALEGERANLFGCDASS